MKKTISINLNKIVFNIEEDAYAILHDYLDALKAHFGQTGYGIEILSDIEARFAEQFLDNLKKRSAEAINIEQTNEAISNMGSVEDLISDTKTDQPGTNNATSVKRRLYRNPDDLVISGVSSGVANYFNIDPLLIRIAFVISTLLWGYGILVYIIMWAIVPKAETAAQKLEMKGAPVNLSSLEENAKLQQNRMQKFSLFRYFIKEVFYLFGRFVRALGPIILSVLGILATAVAFVTLFSATLLAILMLFDPNSTYIDPAITQVFNGSEYVLLIISGFTTVLIPTLVGLIIGVSFIRRKNSFTLPLVILFGIIWTAGALTFGYLATSTAPQIDAAVKSIEARPESSKEIVVSEFDAIYAQSDERIKISHGSKTKVMAYGRTRELDNLEIKVVDGQLTIDYKEDFRVCIFCINRPVSLEIITPFIQTVDATSASQVEIVGFNNINEFTIRSNDAAQVEFTGRVSKMNIETTNAARVNLSGTADNLKAELSNAARLEASNFVSATVIINALNSSDAQVYAKNKIDATASGASEIRYDGSPKEEIIKESHSAQIIKL